MGLSVSSITADKQASGTNRGSGLRDWLASLSPRDRLIYGVLVSVTLIVISIYIVMAVRLLLAGNASATVGLVATATPTPTLATETTQPSATLEPSATPTERPSATPEPSATPDRTATALAEATSTPTPLAVPTSDPLLVPTTLPASDAFFELYFADPTGQLLIPVSRPANGGFAHNAQRAVRIIDELTAGPAAQSGLNSAVPVDLSLNQAFDLGDELLVDLADAPADTQALRALALALTAMPEVEQVQFRVNGVPVGLGSSTGPLRRTVLLNNLNIDNPDGLPLDTERSGFRPLYFQTNDGRYFVRITRVVPRTPEVAFSTIEALLSGPGDYSSLLTSPIPAGTRLLDVTLAADGLGLVVDLSPEFGTLTDEQQRWAAVHALVFSLTDLRNNERELIERVELRIEGQPLADFWGPAYRGPFERPLMNPE